MLLTVLVNLALYLLCIDLVFCCLFIHFLCCNCELTIQWKWHLVADSNMMYLLLIMIFIFSLIYETETERDCFVIYANVFMCIKSTKFDQMMYVCLCVHCCLFYFILLFFLRSPAISLGFTTFGWDFCVCDRFVFFFNPTIKVVTFRLRGWCVLGVLLLPAFTRLGHERQDLLSPCDEMHVCTD